MSRKYLSIIAGLFSLFSIAAGADDEAGSTKNIIIPDTLVNLIQWTEASGGNGHWYAIMPELMVWDWADSVAHLFIRDGSPGYLATVTSAEENTFIVDSVIRDIDNYTAYDEYCMGGVYLNNVWSWITGEPFEYTNWAPDQPASYFQSGALMMWGNSFEIYGQPGEWEIWYFHHGDFWSIIEWGGEMADTDSDGMPDLWDNCPDDYNPDQANSDRDEFGDACDNCPFYYNPEQADSNGNGIGDVCDTGLVDVGDEIDIFNLPMSFSLEQNFPNPFNLSTAIAFYLPQTSQTKITVLNSLGQEVKTILDTRLSAGEHTVYWDGTDMDGAISASGIYYYRVETDDISETKRMILLK